MQFRWYQNECIDAIYNYFASGKSGNPIAALPTGTGKSVIIGGFVESALRQWPWQRVVMLTHVKELIEQNARKLLDIWPTAPVGIYSAGLKRKDIAQPIIFGGVASVVKNVGLLGHRDLVLIDECHLVSDKETSMYRKILDEMLTVNPFLKVIGFTATAYRLKMGALTENGIFTDLCYDMTTMTGFTKLLAEGFLSPLIARPTTTELDVSGVSVTGGEFSKGQLEREVDKTEITYRCVSEMVERGADRQSWLVFGSGIKHAENIADTINAFGIPAVAVHSKLPTLERDARLAAFKRGEIRCVVNNGILTTGFDHPPIDLIGMLRPTLSPGLWVQMLGRGTRPYDPATQHIPGFERPKENCLVLDFAGNTKRLGPINDPIVPKKPGERAGTGDAPVKICDNCGCYNHASARYCGGEPFPTPSGCGFEFKFAPKLTPGSSDAPLMRLVQPEVNYFKVDKVVYALHRKTGSPDMMRVSYFCGLNMYREFVCFEHEGYAGKRARDWWRTRTGYNGDIFPTSQQAVDYAKNLKIPYRIRVWVNKKYPEILSYEF